MSDDFNLHLQCVGADTDVCEPSVRPLLERFPRRRRLHTFTLPASAWRCLHRLLLHRERVGLRSQARHARPASRHVR